MNVIYSKANQTVARFQGGTEVLFSYSQPVAAIKDGHVYRTSKFWSQTTSKHINEFVREHGGNAEHEPQEFFDGLVK